MKTNSTFLQRYSLSVFLILTPLISLAIPLLIPLPTAFIALLLILIPAGMAIMLTGLAEGRKSLATLLKKLFQWRAGLKGYALALGLPLGVHLTVGVLAFLLGWIPSIQIRVPSLQQLIISFIFVAIVAILEELGWRGYALPGLLAHRSALFSALLIGIMWGSLHLGIGLIDGRPLAPTFLAPLGISVVLTWLFLQTRGSLAMAILCHFGFDYFPQFLPGIPLAHSIWSQAIVSLALALILIILYGPNLQPSRVKKPALVGTEQVETR
jgi:membrane protease YdiL (CAAX protease family)